MQTPPQRPATLAGAAALVGLEALALLAGVVYLLVELATVRAGNTGGAVFVLVLAVLATLGVALTARGLWRARRASRAPALLTQLLLLPVAMNLLHDGVAGWGLPLLVVAGAAAVLLLVPSTGAGLRA